MTNKKQVGSKLANSVRQAKELQTQQSQQTEGAQQRQEDPVMTTAKEEIVTTYYIKPSKRVWPD